MNEQKQLMESNVSISLVKSNNSAHKNTFLFIVDECNETLIFIYKRIDLLYFIRYMTPNFCILHNVCTVFINDYF